MKRFFVVITLIVYLALAACTTPPVTLPSVTPEATLTATPVSSSTAVSSPTPTAIPSATPTPRPRALTICLGSEPVSLYLYEDDSYTAKIIREALYDGPIDTIGYTYRPVILQKLPSLADGDAVVNAVPVERGMQVVDARGDVVNLTSGTRIRPSGCRADDCAITFDERPIAPPVMMDSMQVTFTLKSGLRWSDGTPLTAHDAVYSFDLARHAATPNWKWLESRTQSYVATDDLTVVWTGLPGFLNSTYATAFWTPLPNHAWQRYTPATLLEQAEVRYAPLGYGPYVITQWQPGRSIRLSANPHYFRATEGLPFFDTLTFRFISNQNVKTALDALAQGQCDVLSLDLYLERDLPTLREMEKAGTAKMYAVVGTPWEHLTFNIAPLPDAERPAFFQDVRMRQAIALCLNRQAIIDRVINGLAPLPATFVPPDHPLAADDVVRYSYAPDEGKALLEQIGWRDTDGDGIREAHGISGLFNGTPLRIHYTTTTADMRRQIGEAVVADLAACGIQVEVEQLEAANLFKGGAGTPLYGRHFDIAEFAWLTDIQPPCNLYLSSEIPSADNNWDGQNFGGYHNAGYDAVCEEALATLPGEANYLSAHREAQRLLSTDLPMLPLFFRPRIYAARADLQGFVPDPIAVETWNIESFALTEE